MNVTLGTTRPDVSHHSQIAVLRPVHNSEGTRAVFAHIPLPVWVSIGPMGVRQPDPLAPRLPAVLDTAFTDNFLIHQQQLHDFAGLEPGQLRRFNADLRAHSRQIPIYAANLWIHSNKPGERDGFADAAPLLLELHRGIGVCVDADFYPRMPLLGARALRQAQLQVFLDYSKFQVSVRTPFKFWLFH